MIPKILSNPTAIHQTLDGRESSYKAGCSSPAVYYWRRKDGDREEAKKILGVKHSKRLHGWRVGEAVCGVGDYWYTVQV